MDRMQTDALEEAEFHYGLGDITQARRIFNALLSAHGHDDEMRWRCTYGIARCILWGSGASEAVSLLIGLLKRNDIPPLEQVRMRNYLATYYLDQRRYQPAYVQLNQAEFTASEHALAIEMLRLDLNFARVQLFRGSPTAAAMGAHKIMEQVGRLQPPNEELQAELAVGCARLLVHAFDPQQARELIERFRVLVTSLSNVLQTATMSMVRLHADDPRVMEREIAKAIAGFLDLKSPS